MDIRTKEAIRYLGYGSSAVDERTLQLIRETFTELEVFAEKKFIYRIFEISSENDSEIWIDNLKIKSKNLAKNLKNCHQVILLGITLGASVDRIMHKYEILDMTRAVVMQACAAAVLEEYCDEKQEELSKLFADESRYLRPRFSPGYGDFSILHQKDVLEMLDAPKRIGLSMTEGYMLTPTKSVTAVIGISRTKENCHKKGCVECTKTDCVYRRS